MKAQSKPWSFSARRCSPSARMAQAMVLTQWTCTTTRCGMRAWTVVSIEGRRPVLFRSVRTKAVQDSQAGSLRARAAMMRGMIERHEDVPRRGILQPGAGRLDPHDAIVLQRRVAARGLHQQRIGADAGPRGCGGGRVLPLEARPSRNRVAGESVAGSWPCETPCSTRSVAKPALRPPATSCSALSPMQRMRCGIADEACGLLVDLRHRACRSR